MTGKQDLSLTRRVLNSARTSVAALGLTALALAPVNATGQSKYDLNGLWDIDTEYGPDVVRIEQNDKEFKIFATTKSRYFNPGQLLAEGNINGDYVDCYLKVGVERRSGRYKIENEGNIIQCPPAYTRGAPVIYKRKHTGASK